MASGGFDVLLEASWIRAAMPMGEATADISSRITRIRLDADEGIINRFGFNNEGMAAIAARRDANAKDPEEADTLLEFAIENAGRAGLSATLIADVLAGRDLSAD